VYVTGENWEKVTHTTKKSQTLSPRRKSEGAGYYLLPIPGD